MKKWYIPVAALAFFAMTFGIPIYAMAAHQSRVCDTYNYFTDSLVENYGEQLIDARKKPDGGRYEIWKSSETGSWTVLEVMPNNVETCVLGTGVVDPHTPDELMQRNAYTERGI